MAWIAVFSPVMQAQTDAITPWAVLATHSASVQKASTIGPFLPNAAGDLYVANALVGAAGSAKTFGDTSTTATWISKVSTSGGYAVQLGGFHYISLLAFDPAGNLLIAGYATATGVPATSGAYRPAGTVDGTPVVCKLRVLDGTPLFCTYFENTASGVPVLSADSNLNVNVVMGSTLWKLDPSGSTARTFVRKVSADGSAVLWETNTPVGASWIGIDGLGVVTLTGYTQAINLPVHHSTALCPLQGTSAQSKFDGGSVLVRLSGAGELLQSTFLGLRLQSITVSATTAAGYIAWTEIPETTLTVSEIGPDVTGTYATALGCVGNAALPAYPDLFNAIAPGEIISIFGEGLGPDASSLWSLTPDNRLSSSLAGVQVTFDGVPAPLLYVQSLQINAVTPWSLIGKSSTQLCVNYSNKNSCGLVAVVPATPAIFTAAPGVNGVVSLGAAINQDGTLNTLQNPAPAGSVVALFLTGLGPLSPGEPDGAITPWPAPALAYAVQASFFYTDSPGIPFPADVLYAGPAPLAVGGLYQVNVRIARSAGALLRVSVTLPDGSVVYSQSVEIATQ